MDTWYKNCVHDLTKFEKALRHRAFILHIIFIFDTFSECSIEKVRMFFYYTFVQVDKRFINQSSKKSFKGIII